MRAHHSRRAVRLASALIAAGLCLTAAPQALAADDSGPVMKLSSAEAKKLAAEVTLDPYVTAEDTTGTQKADDTAPASDAAGPDTKVTMTAKSTLEGVRGMGATVPVGRNGDYFSVNSMGYVQRHAADGSEKWARAGSSFFTDWQVKPLQPWRTEPYPAQILMGYNAVSPFSANSDSGYATGDLTGDGVPDLVFTALVGATPYPRAFTSPGSDLSTGTFVTVLDGRTGTTVWSKLYNHASMVKIVDGTLLIADAPRMSGDAKVPAGATLTLTGMRFSTGTDGRLTPAQSWTYDSKEARYANWGDIQDLGKGRIAVSWNLGKDDGVDSRGRTLVLDTADGATVWQSDGMLYSRKLRLDAGRKRLVAIEQADATDAVRYEVASYDLKTGHRATLDARENVLPTALTVGDLGAKAGDEYAVAESSLDENYYVNASTVRVVDGADPGSPLWSSTIKRDADNSHDAPSVWGLGVADGSLVASAQDDREINDPGNRGGNRYASLTVFSGKGAVKWQQKGVAAAPMYQDLYGDDRGTHVRVVDLTQNIRTYKVGNGKAEGVTPLQGDIAYARSTDLNKDGKADLVMGGESNGVFAYSGPSLVDGGKPEKLWQATLPGAVHDIELGDVDGDGRPEIVVAADTATVVLNGRTGRTLATIAAGEGRFVRSVQLTDLDGDGAQDLLVPTDALRAYHGDGHALWTYSAPKAAGDVRFADASVGDGRVYASYASLDAFGLDAPVTDAVALNAKTGRARWSVAPKAPDNAVGGIRTAIPNEGVFASKEIPYADGHAVIYLWGVVAPLKTANDSLNPQNYFEIRDGRTGEVLHSGLAGGLWTHNSYFAKDGVLYSGDTASFRRYRANGDDKTQLTTPTSYGGGFMTGPGGRELLVSGSESGLGIYDPSILDSQDSWEDPVAGITLMGARNYFAGDLDGDGVDEVMSLNSDDSGRDRTVGLFGGGYYVTDNGIHQVTTYKLS
ncbi:MULTISPECIES: VCBS repeat-containing protein [unclassified Streptomyces]|uniref:FG-GAP repeat domain-containing protein n=1 Tax=unclassified Streptomyces TaxID=2593676 RepID=UPI000DBAB021|nr:MULTISPECIES: VCBS repeat-containing protein [unclassified Streptomyces]MYT72860.1 VCBS repeat-containing protein [Streptomyces sp. SID8367]RAJ78836.1 VCBS repeat protein [Streptomyces sp. PsTaAH-137]